MQKRVKTRLPALLLALGMLMSMVPAAAAEGEGSGGTTAETPVTLASASLDQHTMALKEGEKGTLTVTLKAQDGSTVSDIPEGTRVTWESTDPDEVSVSPQEGSLTATVEALKTADTDDTIKEVSITVTVTLADGKALPTDTCNITVSPNDAAGITVVPQTVELPPKQTNLLSATVTPETADQTVTWATKDAAVATVEANDPSTTATVTGVSAGETTIFASANGLQTECLVQVQGIVLADEERTLRVGKNDTLAYTIYGDSLQKQEVTWISDDRDVVDVNQGYLYPKSVGTATITVSINGYSNYKDTVKITVEKATADVIHASATTGDPLSFSSLLSELRTQSSNVLEKSLRYVSALSVSTQQGTLYYNYVSEGNTGDGVASSANYYVSPGNGQEGLNNITFVPKSDFEGTAVIYYTGYASDGDFFQGTIEVTVDAPDDVTYTSGNGNVVQFEASDFALVCRQQTGGDLSYVTFTLPDESRGTLYEGYRSDSYPGNPVSVSTKYKYSGSPNLEDVYFLPKAGTSGTVTIPYTGYAVNGASFRGRVSIQVKAAVASGDITYSISQGGRVTFDDSDFNSLSRDLTGYSLNRVRFELPPSSQGTLYYNYTSDGNYASLVTEDRNYYRSSSLYLDNVTFVASKDYAGTVAIPFTGWDSQGNRFSGQVGISVSSQGSGTVRYSTYRGGTVTLDDNDFNNLSQDLTGSNLSYVRFTLPASSRGTLYYKYTSPGNYDSKVSESRSYYRSSTPRLDNITFVADDSFTGTVTIDFTAWNTKKEKFSGVVEIDVGTTQNPLNYQVAGGSVLTFQDGDFDDYCRTVTGDDLDYVRFTLPAASQGTLYYSYTSSGSYSSKVSASRNYYSASSPYLDRVSFVPNSSYAGTFSLNFTGRSTEGRQFSGTVTITVAQKQAGSITYSTAYNPVTFRAADFVSACNQRGGGTLKSVQFTGVGQLHGGRLYYGYNGIHATNSQVRSTAVYYPSSTPNLSEISFVPLVGFQGTVSLNYTATDSKGATYQGSVNIQVTPNTTSRHFTDLGSASWATAAVDFLYENGVVSGTQAGIYSPQASITRGSFLVMMDRAFEFPGTGDKSFSDVPADAYYASAVRKAYALGIVSGCPDGTFRPDEAITREAAATMLYRAMVATGWSIGAQQESALYGYSDWQSVSSYARGPMSVLVKNGLLLGNSQNQLRPGQTMSRAEAAVLLARSVTL